MAASRWALPTDVHARVLDQDLVFLDLAQGAYFCLPGVGNRLHLEGNGNVIVLSDEELCGELIQGGLIVSLDQAQRRMPAHVNRRLQDIGETPGAAPLPVSLGEVGRVIADAARLYRRRSLGALVRHVQLTAPDEQTSAFDAAALTARIHAFPTVLAFVPFQGECLYRAFLMLLYLRRGGFDAQWVFGVRTWPFHAHCWLQSGDLVLGDTVERLVSYEPILVV